MNAHTFDIHSMFAGTGSFGMRSQRITAAKLVDAAVSANRPDALARRSAP